ncbi:MAG: PAS domain S-box protein, partial [Blastocatellia bacterium]
MGILRKLLFSRLWRRLVPLLVIILLVTIIFLALSLRRQQLAIASTNRLTGQVDELELSLFGLDEWARKTPEPGSEGEWRRLYSSYLNAHESTNMAPIPSADELSAPLSKLDPLLKQLDQGYRSGASEDAQTTIRTALDPIANQALMACGRLHSSLSNLTSSQASTWQVLTLLVLISFSLALLALGLISINQALLTKRLHSEQALREREARFALMVQKSSDIITLVRTDGTILYESPSVRSILGYAPEELVGKSGFDHVHHEDRARIEADLKEALEHTNGIPSLYRFINRDGEWRW